MFILTSPFKEVIEPWPGLCSFMRKWFGEFQSFGIPDDVAKPIYGALSYAYANNRGILVTGGDRKQRMYIAERWACITRREEPNVGPSSPIVKVQFINMLDPLEADVLDRWECPDDYRDLFGKHVILAEIGIEEVNNHFGVRENPVTSFVSAYYGGKRGKWSLSYTTPLTEEDLKTRYLRCFDLMAEESDWINLPLPIPLGGEA